MEQKIQELTDKIYQEGVEKGEEKSRQLIKEAESKSSVIITDARSQADKIIADAKKQAEEFKRNTHSEIRLAGAQALASVKQQILDIVTAQMTDHGITATLSDPVIIKELILQVAQNWKAEDGQLPTMEILLPESKQNELSGLIENSLGLILKNGFECRFKRSIKAGFRIGPADGGYKVSLTDEDFKEFFKEFVRPKARKFLFNE